MDRIAALEESKAGPRLGQEVRIVIRSALEYGLETVETGVDSQSIPPQIATHARNAVWLAFDLQTLTLRYLAGYSLFRDYLLSEPVGSLKLNAREVLRDVLRSTDASFEQMLIAIGGEYHKEQANRYRSSEASRHNRIRRLLSGELADASDLAYDVHGVHVAVIGIGENAEDAITDLGRLLGSSVLRTRTPDQRTWAWLGVSRSSSTMQISRELERFSFPGVSMAVGDFAFGLSGWRLTHRQASAAVPVALRLAGKPTLYPQVARLASALGDDLLITGLMQRYLDPLSSERDGGKALRATLRAYFAADRNASAAASALGIERHTITNRLRSAERCFGRSVASCAGELELALELETLGLWPEEAPAVL